MPARVAAIVAGLLALSSCSGSPTAPAPATPARHEALPTQDVGPATLVGAGDIAICGAEGSERTARLLDRIGGTVFAAGDNAYYNGTDAEYRDCYGSTWGRHKARTRPAPGNHEYGSAGATPYFQYFGSAAGPFGAGYYSYELGAWHVVVLNSEIAAGAGSAQEQWLRADLAASSNRCTVAYFHRPRFSSGPHGDNPAMHHVWQALHDFGVEIAISGHDHLYERYAPQDPAGRPDPARGIRQFVVGTGGGAIYAPRSIRPNSEIIGGDWGVLALTLESTGYRWEFVPVDGGSFRDAGTGTCH